MFDDISGDYDLMNRIISFGLDGICRRRAVQPHRDDKIILDICSGTGDMAKEILRLKGFDGHIILADFSMKMRELARQKLGENQRVTYVICDAENLPFEDSVFDGITNGYSLRNLSDLEAFGSEIERTLKSGGQATIVDVAHPPNKVIARLFYIYFYKLIPLISRLFTKKKYAYRYLPASLRTFLKQDEVLAALSSTGLNGDYQHLLWGAVAVYRLRKK